ncbi:site-2 protease family protein [Actinocorallia longicatena]|uniref:Site-2 protease family protein n=1 Tax=Actinocorallia longicatena TaxID=111803 RepID=A0ABP6QKS5_9ACTN
MLVLGIVLFFVLLMASIALHEFGHMVFAKWFGVRVPQFMVGFGPTIRSWRRGETEYGVKWIPLGGYVRMIGMLPPRAGDPEGHLRPSSTGRFSQLIDAARAGALEEVGPGDEDRVYYRKAWWQKALISFAGPMMNFLLAFVFLAVALMGIGLQKPTSTIGTVAACVLPATEYGRACTPADPPTPAAAAGLRPGDVIVDFDGTPITDYTVFQRLIRDSAGRQVTLTVRRDGQALRLTPKIIPNTLPDLKNPKTTVTGGFLGITPATAHVRQGPGAVIDQLGAMTTGTLQAFAHFPEKMRNIWAASFGGEKRDADSPMGVVGASRIGGEVLSSRQDNLDKIFLFVLMLGSINFAVGAFNLLPLLPLDGGNIVGAFWEGIKRGFARLTRRPMPGPVDVAKALPLTYVVGALIVVMGLLLAYADLVNPVKLGG